MLVAPRVDAAARERVLDGLCTVGTAPRTSVTDLTRSQFGAFTTPNVTY